MEPIGHVVGTEVKPNTAYAFYFWAKREAGLGIGSVVKVVLPEEPTTIYGTVVEAQAYNDLPSALADYLATQGVPGATAPTKRPEIRFFEAAVLRREPDEPVAAVGIGTVYEADATDLRVALRGDKFEEAIPIGVFGALQKAMPVFADAEYLLGPEAGHLNVTGTSGLAAKTSYIQFLLHSIFHKHKGVGEEGVAAVLFNVKGGDLLYLDMPTKGPLPAEHAKMYEVCGLPVKPFAKVCYFAPFADAAHSELSTLRNHESLMQSNPTQGFCYGLKDVLKHAEVLLNKEDLDVKADAFLQFLAQDVAGNLRFQVGDRTPLMRVSSLKELVEAVKQMLAVAETSRDGYKTHHAATVRKMLNRINSFSLRFPGLISDSGESTDFLPKSFEDRTAYVIDVSQISVDAQDLIFAAVISDLRERMEKKQLGVKRVIVVVDELNKYAPSGGRETYVLQSLRDIAARGRYLGLCLFGAQQFRSRVDAQVVGNSANSVYGHIQLEELANPIYTVYSQAVREKLATASPGEMMVRHPHFSQPVFIRFPIPCCLRGSDGMSDYPMQSPRPLEEEVMKMAVRLGKGAYNEAQISQALAALDTNRKEESLRKIQREFASASQNGGCDPLEIIRREGKVAPRERVRQDPVEIVDDPFV